jgi:hypothetical protein
MIQVLKERYNRTARMAVLRRLLRLDALRKLGKLLRGLNSRTKVSAFGFGFAHSGSCLNTRTD